MRNFKDFLTEEYHNLLLLEAKVDDFANKWMKIHAQHSTVKQNPEKAREMIKHAFALGQSADEHMYITTQYLNGTLKPKEDDPTIDHSLKFWRRLVDRNLHGNKKLSEYDHNSLMSLFEKFPELQKKKQQAGAVKEIEQYHIGKINHPEYGPLDVYHIQKDNVRDNEEYVTFSKAMKKVCTIPGSTVCVQHDPEYVRHYSKGHGFFAYLDKDGIFRLGHGNADRTIVRHNNNELRGDEEKSVANQTEQLIKNPAHRILHRLRFKPNEVENSEISDNIEDPSIIEHITTSSSHNMKDVVTPESFKKILHSEKTPKHLKTQIIAGLERYISDETIQGTESENDDLDFSTQKKYLEVLKDPKLHEKLIELGHHTILDEPEEYSVARRMGIKKAEDHNEKVFDSFLRWKPEKLDIDYKHRIPENEVLHDKEHDMQHILDNQSDYFTPEKFERIIKNPNFGVHHGRIAAQVLYNAIKFSDDPNKHRDLIKAALSTDSPHIHHVVLEMANNSSNPAFKDIVTHQDITRILDNSKKYEKFMPKDGVVRHIAESLARSKRFEENLEQRSRGIVKDDDFISSIFNSNNHEAMDLFLGKTHRNHSEILDQVLTEKEVENMALSGNKKLMGKAISMENFPKHALDLYLKDKKNPRLALAALDGVHRDKITPEHVEMAWDTHKSGQHKLFDGEDDGLERLYETIFKHNKATQRIKDEIVHSKNPIIVSGAMVADSANPNSVFKKPEVVSKILDTMIESSKDHPQKEHYSFTQSRFIILKKLLAKKSGFEDANLATADPEHLIKIADNLANLTKSYYPGNDRSSDKHELIHRLYSHPNMPHERIIRDYKLATEKYTKQMEDVGGFGLEEANSIISGVHSNPFLSEKILSDIVGHVKNKLETHAKKIEDDTNFSGEDIDIRDMANIASNPALKGQALDDFVDVMVKHSFGSSVKGASRVHSNIAMNPNLKNHHVDAMFDSHFKNNVKPNTFIENLSSNNAALEQLSSETIKKLSQISMRGGYFNDSGITNRFLRHPNLSEKHIGELLRSGIPESKTDPIVINLRTAANLLINPNSTEDHISHIIKHGIGLESDPSTQKNETNILSLLVPYYPGQAEVDVGTRVTEKQLQDLRSKVTPKHIDLLYEKGYKNVAARYRNHTDEQITRFIDDYEKEEREARVISDANNKPILINGKPLRIPNSNRGVIEKLSENKNLSGEHIDRIHKLATIRDPNYEHGENIKYKDYYIQQSLYNTNLSPELVINTLNNTSNPNLFAEAHRAAKLRNITDDKTLSDKLHDYISNSGVTTNDKIDVLHRVNKNHEDIIADDPVHGSPYKTSAIEPRHYEALMPFVRPGDFSTSSAQELIRGNKKMTGKQIEEILKIPDLHPELHAVFSKAHRDKLGFESSFTGMGSLTRKPEPPEDPTQYALRA